MSYYQPTGKYTKPNFKQHIQLVPEKDGSLNTLLVSGPYPAEVAAFIDSMMSRDSASVRTGGRVRGFFGKWYYKPTSGKPEPVVYSRDLKDQSETDSFERAKNSGQIVMNPAMLSRVNLEWHPVERPAGPVLPSEAILLDKHDFKSVTAIHPQSSLNLIKLSNGNWYDPGTQFKIYTQFVRETEWHLPFINLSNTADLLCSFERDGSLVSTAGARLNEATFDILTEMAELPSTLGMFRDASQLFAKRGKKMRRLISDIAKDSGSPTGLLKVADKVASARLMYRYGIMPLKYTYDDVKDLLKESFKRQYVSGLATKTVSDVPKFMGASFTGGYSQEHKAFFKRRLDPDSKLDQFQAVFGANLPLTLWELTPWSLVVDWFINAGDYLTSINPMPSLEEKGCYPVRIGMNGRYITTDGNILVVDLQHYSRTIINRISDSSIQFQPNMNNARYMDAAAFSWQIIRGKIKKLKK